MPCLTPGDLPNPGIEPTSPALQADSLPSEPPGKPFYGVQVCSSKEKTNGPEAEAYTATS